MDDRRSHSISSDLEQEETHVSAYEQIAQRLASIGTRGVGNYVCPFGSSCTKGGWRDGMAVVFNRNSSFKAHLQKHSKSFKCNLPGCSNKTGFARSDQLRRHQEIVPHK